MLKVGLPVALAIIMFGMGLGLTFSDFTRVFSKPKAFLTGAFLQLISLPIIAFLLLSIFPVSAALAVGFMILAACPGGVTSNLLTYIGKGDVALSVSLTCVISLLGFITVPLITSFALDHFMGQAAPELPIAKTIIGILIITVVPLSIGMLVRKLSASTADKLEKAFGPISFIVFILVVIGALIAEADNVIPYIKQSGLLAIILLLITMGLAAAVAAAMKLPQYQQTAIILECGLQNSTLGIAVAITILDRVDISVPIAVYGLLMLFVAFAYAMWRRRGAEAG